MSDATELATMISERMDYNLRVNDLWSDAAKELASYILEAKSSAPKAWLTEWVFKNKSPETIKNPSGGSAITRNPKEAAEKLAFYQSLDLVESVTQSALFDHPSLQQNVTSAISPQMIRDTAAWCQSEAELRETLCLAAQALEAASSPQPTATACPRIGAENDGGQKMLSKRHFNVLRRLADAQQPIQAWNLPNGHGHCSGGSMATKATMDELEDLQLVVYSKNGYLATAAGRAALHNLAVTEGSADE